MDDTIRRSDFGTLETGEELRRFEGHDGGVCSICVLDARHVMSASEDGPVRLWAVETGEELRRFERHGGGVYSICVLNTRHVISASEDKTLRLWDVETGVELRRFKGHDGAVRSVAVFGTHHVISGSSDRTLRLWDAARVKSRLARAHNEGHIGERLDRVRRQAAAIRVHPTTRSHSAHSDHPEFH